METPKRAEPSNRPVTPKLSEMPRFSPATPKLDETAKLPLIATPKLSEMQRFLGTPSISQTPKLLETPKRKFFDPDFLVFQLKDKRYDDFETFIISELTKHLEFSMIEDLKGQFTYDKKKKGILSAFENLLPKKDKEDEEGKVNDKLYKQICQLATFLNKNLEVQGIFRKSGNHQRQQQLIDALKAGAIIDFEESGFKPFEAADALKTYLKSLKEPLLIPSKYYDAHLQIANLFMRTADGKVQMKDGKPVPNKAKRIKCLQLLLFLLPPQFRMLLRAILNLLYNTAKLESKNKMSASNLSTMVAPHLIWHRDFDVSSPELKETVEVLNQHVAFMIRHHSKILVATDELRRQAQEYFPDLQHPSMLSPQVTCTSLITPSSAAKRRINPDLVKQTTKAEVDKLIMEGISNMPDSAKKTKLMKNIHRHEEVQQYNKSEKRHKRRSTHQGSRGFLKIKSKLTSLTGNKSVDDIKINKSSSLNNDKPTDNATSSSTMADHQS